MKRQYSSNSARLMHLPACFESLRRSIRHDRIEITKGSAALPEKDQAEALKEVSLSQFPIKIAFLRRDGAARIELSEVWTILYVEIEGLDPQKTTELYQVIEKELDLKEPTEEDRRGIASLPSMMSAVWTIHDMVEDISRRLEHRSAERQSRKRCFVSFRFDDHSKALALELKEFLEMVGVNFVSGLGYEPRSISEKVLDRLTAPLDLFIVIFSTAGESAWLNQEIGVARGRKLPVLVLKEEGFDADFGMLGDTEYLAFPQNSISRTFVGILQALSYLGKKVPPTTPVAT